MAIEVAFQLPWGTLKAQATEPEFKWTRVSKMRAIPSGIYLYLPSCMATLGMPSCPIYPGRQENLHHSLDPFSKMDGSALKKNHSTQMEPQIEVSSCKY